MPTNTPLTPGGQEPPPSSVISQGQGSSRRRRRGRTGRSTSDSDILAGGERHASPGSVSVLEDEDEDHPELDSLLLKKLEALEQEVHEKDHLVTALTVQLEEAAERLDRMQRMGNDRNSARGGGSLPREFVEDQRVVSENVQRLVEQWDEVQPASAFGRLEMQLSELRDLIAGRLVAATDAVPEAVAQASAGPMSAWEAMKASMLGESPATLNEGADAVPSPAGGVVESPEEIAVPEPPPAVDPAHASVEQLREAVDHRDQFIATLIRKLRASESRRLSVQAFGGAELPEEVQSRLQELENLVVEQQRLTEMELSLERARLGREEARLRHLEEALLKELKRQGLAVGQPKRDEPPANESPKSRRWRRILGIVRDEGE